MATKREKKVVDLSRPYEENIIGMRGIIYFGIGLFLLIVITFALMWVLQYILLEEQAKEADMKSRQPMTLSQEERLPPEPRLQAAPGFGVDSENGRVVLELKEPQAEWWELERQWQKLWTEGQKDPATGTVIALPIEEAKQKLLEQGMKSRTGEEAEKAFRGARMMVSDSSAGRLANEERR